MGSCIIGLEDAVYLWDVKHFVSLGGGGRAWMGQSQSGGDGLLVGRVTGRELAGNGAFWVCSGGKRVDGVVMFLGEASRTGSFFVSGGVFGGGYCD